MEPDVVTRARPMVVRIASGLSALASPRVRVGRRSWSAFHACGAVGLAVGVPVSVGLTLHRGLSLGVLAVLILTALGTFLGLALLTKRVVGEERLVYYHHEVAILATATVLLWWLGGPVAAYLDVLILGVGAFLVFGRAGCFMVGCCHGRPRRLGVRYRSEHADAGFTRYLVGVPLFPVQLVEAAWVLGTVAVGVGIVLSGAAPGAALVWYVIVYDVGRFGFEFLRGDGGRPYRAGFSEAQWTSLGLMLVIVGAGAGGALPLDPWHVVVTVGLGLAIPALAIRRRLRSDALVRFLSAAHIEEVAEVLERLDGRQPVPVARSGRDHMVHLGSTSAGLRLSTGRGRDAGDEVRHYTFSVAGGTLRDADARALAELLVLLGGHLEGEGEGEVDAPRESRGGRVLSGRDGVFHLVAPAPPATSPRTDPLAHRAGAFAG